MGEVTLNNIMLLIKTCENIIISKFAELPSKYLSTLLINQLYDNNPRHFIDKGHLISFLS